MRLIIDGFGKFVGREDGLIVVKDKGKVVRKVKPDELKQVIFCGKASISTDAIALLLKNSVDVVFLGRSGDVTGRLAHPFVGTAKTRREQYLAYNDWRSIHLSKEIVSAKIRNQATILGNLAKSRKDSDPSTAQKLKDVRTEVLSVLDDVSDVHGDKIDDVREEILGLEGKASKVYWDAVALIIPEEYKFSGRQGLIPGQTRYAQDSVNASLNYGYAILHSECVRAVELAGLDVYAGFLHADRAGRTSLALDLMEEFRQQIVDRTVLRLISRRKLKPDCNIVNFVCTLSDEQKKVLLTSILERLDAKTQFEGRNYKYSTVILNQARKIASFLRGERKSYSGFWQNW